MRSTSRFRRMPRPKLGVLPLLVMVAGCSVLNHFDDVKPETVGQGGNAGTAGTPDGGSGGTAGAAGAGGSSTGGGGTSGGNTGGSHTGGSNAGGSNSPDGSAGASGSAGSTGPGAGGSAGFDASANDGALADATEGGALVDRGSDAPRMVTCQFTQAVPRLIDDYQSQEAGANRTLNDGLAIQAVGNGSSVRIIAQHQGNPDGYLVYFASDVPGGMMQTITSHGRVVDVRKRDANTTSVLVINTGDPGMPGPQPAGLDLHQFDDSASMAMPTVTTLTNPNQLGTTFQIDARFSPAADGIALAASYQLPNNQYRAVFGLYKGMPVNLVQLADDPNSEVVRPQAVVRTPNMASFVFTNQANPTEFAITDSTGGFFGRTIPGTAFVVDSSMSTNGMMSVIMADFSASLQLLVGQIDPMNAMAFDSSQLAVAKEAMSATEIPFSQPTITGDQLFMLGPTGAVGKELSLLWVDMAGHTRASQKLMDTTGLVKAGAVVPRDAFGGTLGGRFHVVWVERLGDANGDYDRLYYDQLQCF